MQLFLPYSSLQLTLLVCLFIFVVNAAPTPLSSSVDTKSSSSSSGSSEPSKYYFTRKTTAYRDPPPGTLSNGMPGTGPYVQAQLAIYGTKSLVKSRDFNTALVLAVETLLMPAMPTIMRDLKRTFLGMKYDLVHPPVIEPITWFYEFEARAQQENFYQFEISFYGRDNQGRKWATPSRDMAYTLTISKKCVTQAPSQPGNSDGKFRFVEKLLSGELGRLKTKEVLVKFKNGKQLDQRSWYSKLKDKVTPTKKSKGVVSS